MSRSHCPICDGPLKTWRDTLDLHLLLEAEEECPEGHYYSSFGYGIVYERYGDMEFTRDLRFNSQTPIEEGEYLRLAYREVLRLRNEWRRAK